MLAYSVLAIVLGGEVRWVFLGVSSPVVCSIDPNAPAPASPVRNEHLVLFIPLLKWARNATHDRVVERGAQDDNDDADKGKNTDTEYLPRV